VYTQIDSTTRTKQVTANEYEELAEDLNRMFMWGGLTPIYPALKKASTQ